MDGQSQMIELKGIVRNRTKLGVEDGQCEDIINMRFRNGAWRPSGDGKFVFVMGATDDSKPYVTVAYAQIYVHTNIYRHVLGVRNGTLYWFAEIDKDGETFYPIDNTSDRTSWPADYQSLPTAPVALTTVTGDVWITQTGHLLTIIDENDDFEHLVFKTGDKKYKSVFVDANGKASNRTLFPFGQVHLNLYCPGDDAHKVDPFPDGSPQYSIAYQATDVCANAAKKKNLLTQHLLAVVAFEMYDGSYAYACNPVHLCPREGISYICETKKRLDRIVAAYTDEDIYQLVVDISNPTPGLPPTGPSSDNPSAFQYVDVTLRKDDGELTGVDSDNVQLVSNEIRPWVDVAHSGKVFGSDLVLSIDKSIIDNFDETIFNSICIFITTESNVYPTVSSRDDFNNRKEQFDYKGEEKMTLYRTYFNEYENGVFVRTTGGGAGKDLYSPFIMSSGEFYRKKKDIIYDLLHSPFYLLRKYKKEELYELLENPVVKLDGTEYEGVLLTENLVQREQLSIEATSRTTYLPKVSYMYNGRLHIANYKSYPFFGYPLDLFHLHNHSVKVEDGKWFPNDTTQKVLRNLTGNSDDIIQFPKAQKAITNIPDLVNAGAPYFLVQVHIDSEQGEQVVCRYIPAYNPSTPEEGRADFIEDLNALLTFPDVRANKMEIFYVSSYSSGNVYIKHKAFDLKPHPYMNMAYYIDPDLKPIKLADFDDYEQE